MTEAKAKEVLLYFLNRLDGAHYLENGVFNPAAKVEAFSLALAALEKQMPKKPAQLWDGEIFTDDDCWDVFLPACPSCGRVYDDDDERADFCSKCGQALNWKECP